MKFCEALLVVPDRAHRFGVREDFHRFDDCLHAPGGEQVTHDLIPSRDGDRPVLGGPDQGGKLRLRLGDGICRCHA